MRRDFVFVATVALGLPACSGSEAPDETAPPVVPAVTALVGEVHLHQFNGGSHPSASFVADPIPYEGHVPRELVYIEAEPTARVGTCSLYLPPTCAPSCEGDTFCSAPNECTALPSAEFVNGGPVEVLGAAYAPRIDLWFDTTWGGYASDPPAGTDLLFAGRERLEIEGGAGPWHYAGELTAPKRAQLLVPGPSVPIPFVAGEPFPISWVPEQDRTVTVTLSVESPAGYGYIRCYAPDTGSLTIDPTLTAALPAESTRTRLELNVSRQVVLPLAQPELGVVFHVVDTAWLDDNYDTESP